MTTIRMFSTKKLTQLKKEDEWSEQGKQEILKELKRRKARNKKHGALRKV